MNVALSFSEHLSPFSRALQHVLIQILAARGGPHVRRWVMLWLALGMAVLTGCATGPQADPRDPLEPLNRSVSQFNDGLDRTVIKPAAQAYRAVTPDLVRTGVNNFFANLTDVWSAINNLLQAKPGQAAETFLRFNVNTFFGLAGLLDVASELGIERHRADFGQTLARWGVPSGPYLVLPVLGPSTVRDSLAIGLELRNDPLTGIDEVAIRNSLTALRLVEARANLLRAGEVFDDAALDRYTFRRDVFLQRRAAQVRRPGEADPADAEANPDAPAAPAGALPAAPTAPAPVR
jgi:phospholipid-binding lipoprotein MlaA